MTCLVISRGDNCCIYSKEMDLFIEQKLQYITAVFSVYYLFGFCFALFVFCYGLYCFVC